MNLHDFVTESFNLEHIFRDARTVSFCLTTDPISTCLMMFSARFKTAQFWSGSGYVVNGSVVSFLVSDVDTSGTETCQLPCMEYHGERGAETCQHPYGVPWCFGVERTGTENWHGDVV